MMPPRRFLLLIPGQEEPAAVGCQFGEEPDEIYILKWTGSIEIIAEFEQLVRETMPARIRWLD